MRLFASERTAGSRGSPDQLGSGNVRGVYTEYEEFPISEAVCLTLQSFDFVVDAFPWYGRDAMIEVSQGSSFLHPERLGHVLEYLDSGCLCLCDPISQLSLGSSLVR